MRTVELDSWAGFARAIADLRTEFGSRTVPIPDREPISLDNVVLFRGQADSEWKLQTTLERATDSPYTVQHYLQRADSCVNEIESVTGRKWGLKPYPEIVEEIKNTQDFMRVHLPHYDYLVYLRHHGFPSPLLDWTTSAYIAAYFAFVERNTAERSAVFAFIERPDGAKCGTGGEALIRTMGPYVTTHARHFAQKAWYTTATRWDRDARTHTFCSHHDVSATSNVVMQDVLVRITIPRTDRLVALKQLEDYNINHYTLFQSEDALIRAMAVREFDLCGT
jgi:hypothetical protein